MAASASWSGKLCARCGAVRTSNTSAGLPICTPCLKLEREAAARADQPQRRCPVEGAAMELVFVHGIVIDRCPDCGGVFLDKGELVVLQKAAAQAAGAGTGWGAFFESAFGALF
ncbi:MAG: zf-TFIIB domain-containing protein [Planctomycetes bacterium]|nr:zf-TFIIB domain-containing protein [Planctomycetota bacterium]MCC7396544.1 zf-TFIIB domain-containing protein [Planctomycetota bacterium]